MPRRKLSKEKLDNRREIVKLFRESNNNKPATGRLFMKVPVHAPGIRNGETGKPWRGVLPPTWQALAISTFCIG